MGKGGGRRKHLLAELKISRKYCKLKEEILGHIVWRAHFERGYGLVVRQTTF
jgi:hypothetical protein